MLAVAILVEEVGRGENPVGICRPLLRQCEDFDLIGDLHPHSVVAPCMPYTGVNHETFGDHSADSRECDRSNLGHARQRAT